MIYDPQWAKLGRLAYFAVSTPFLFMSASMAEGAVHNVRHMFTFEAPNRCHVIKSDLTRKDLKLHIRPIFDKGDTYIDLLLELREHHRLHPLEKKIVYCDTPAECNRVVKYLKARMKDLESKIIGVHNVYNDSSKAALRKGLQNDRWLFLIATDILGQVSFSNAWLAD